MSAVMTWGSTAEERAAVFPCDAYLENAGEALFRAVSVDAPAATVFRWLCQMRVAPYSYDWIDNGARKSPSELTPGVDALARGQRFMRIFELVEFAPDDHVTLRLVDRGGLKMFGEIAVTYRVIPEGDGSRLIVKMRLVSGTSPLARLRTKLLAAGDLVMMRKQLHTLKRYAERSV